MARHLLIVGFFHTLLFLVIFWKGRNMCRLVSTWEIGCFRSGRWNLICSIVSVFVCLVSFSAIDRNPMWNLSVKGWIPATSRSSIFTCEVMWWLKNYHRRFISSWISWKSHGDCTEYDTAYYTVHSICSEMFLQHRQYMNLFNQKIF